MLDRGFPVCDISSETGLTKQQVYAVKYSRRRAAPTGVCSRCGRPSPLAAGVRLCCDCLEDRIVENERDQKFVQGLNGNIEAVYRLLMQVRSKDAP